VVQGVGELGEKAGRRGMGLTLTRLSSAAMQKAREAIPKLPMTTMAGCCGSGARTLGSAMARVAKAESHTPRPSGGVLLPSWPALSHGGLLWVRWLLPDLVYLYLFSNLVPLRHFFSLGVERS